MKRRDFFRKATLGAGALIAAPVVAKAVAEEPATYSIGSTTTQSSTPSVHLHDTMLIPSWFTNKNSTTEWTIADLRWNKRRRQWVLYPPDEEVNVVKLGNDRFVFIDNGRDITFSMNGYLSWGCHAYYGHYATFLEPNETLSAEAAKRMAEMNYSV